MADTYINIYDGCGNAVSGKLTIIYRENRNINNIHRAKHNLVDEHCFPIHKIGSIFLYIYKTKTSGQWQNVRKSYSKANHQ